MMTDELLPGTVELLCYWLPPDEVTIKERITETVTRLWDRGIRGMIGTACSLADALHLLDERITCHLHLSGFKESTGMLGLVCSVDNAPILPGCIALWGTCGRPDTYKLIPAELQADLSLAKPAGAEGISAKEVTAEQLKGIVGRLTALAAAPAEPKRSRPGLLGWLFDKPTVGQA